ncbi:MAG: chemotaxis protein CheW [Spirochaetes bacterium]|nr:chemotaxis protein CheW [Spirochaetota bacterium]
MSTQASEFLLWKSGNYAFGLELPYCREIVNDVAIARLPRAPQFILGLANLRGSVISVLDLEVLLGYKKQAEYKAQATLIRLRTEGYPLAIAADSIRDTQFLDAQAIEAPPANIAESEDMLIRNVAKLDIGLLLIPNIEAISRKIY